MKPFQLLLLIIALSGKATFTAGQSLPDTQSLTGLKQYIVTLGKVSGQPGERYVKGCLYAITDSSLTLVSPYRLKKDLLLGNPLQATTHPLSAIQNVTVTRRGKAGASILTGMGLGVMVGLLGSSAGVNSSGGYSFNPGPGLLMAVFGLSGTLIGTMVGVVPNKVVKRPAENGKWKELDKYSIATQLKTLSPNTNVTVSYESTYR